tara:strand:- start:2432 stop:4228 length:1797 start_codon:yes stop_codon:yes gene_type:complete
MLVIYHDLKQYFESSLQESLLRNNKISEFEHIRNNIITNSSKEEFGDFQSNICLTLSKIYKRNPREIAEEFLEIVWKTEGIQKLCESCEIAGAGFINIKLKEKVLINQLISNSKCSKLGIPLITTNNRILVDFSSPNIAKEMHVGHLRSTIIGDSLSRLFEFRGYQVLRINHIGDWGTQFGMLITQLKDVFPEALNNANKINLGDLVEFYKTSKKRFDNEEAFKEKSRKEVVKLQSGNKDSISAWKLLCNESRKDFNSIYEILNINILERGESFYNKFLKDVIEELKSKKILVEDQGAQCVFLEGIKNKEGKPLPLIIQKKDGGYNYATTDLAAIRYRFKKRPDGDNVNRIIYVTDHGQATHFASIFQVANKANWIPKNCIVNHVPFGLVQGVDGKKLKTREGETIRLKDLLSEAVRRAKKDLINRISNENRKEEVDFIEHTSKVIGISAIKYADLSQNRITNYQFSFEKMLAFNGNTAPYLLYSLVRISGINRKNNLKKDPIQYNNIHFENSLEWSLLKKLLKFDEIIISVENDLLPNRLCNYLFELCQIFNRFYDNLNILKADTAIKNSRLALCFLTEKTLELGLNILGIETLERM